jgi:hypothetical protein
MPVTYSFTVSTDTQDLDNGIAEEEAGFSVWLDSGEGSSAEIAGRIQYREIAEKIAHDLSNTLDQASIRRIFNIKD